MVIPDKAVLGRLLESQGFETQLTLNEHVFVRASDAAGLFERVEALTTGRHEEAILVTASIAVVRFARAQRRQLIRRAGIDELYDDAFSGKATFATGARWDAWLEKAVRLAPMGAKSLAYDHGAHLLASTRDARERARVVVDTFGPAITVGDQLSPGRTLNQEQLRDAQRLLSRPMMLPRGLEAQAEAAAALLVLEGALDVREAIEDRVVPIDPVGSQQRIPESVHIILSLVLDLLLQAGNRRSDTGRQA